MSPISIVHAEGIAEEQLVTDLDLNVDRPSGSDLSILSEGQLIRSEYGEIGEQKNAAMLLRTLKDELHRCTRTGTDLYAFIATFDDMRWTSEWALEERLWRQLQLLHEMDSEEWNMDVDLDPDSGRFNFSLLGEPFHVVAMHPFSSRNARWSPRPSLVFSTHSHFPALLDAGAYELVLDHIMACERNGYGRNDAFLLSCQLLKNS